MNNLTRYSPTFGSLRREIDRLFDDVLRPGSGEGGPSALWAPHTDISETEDHYVLRLDVPGLSKEDLRIELQGATLTVGLHNNFSC